MKELNRGGETICLLLVDSPDGNLAWSDPAWSQEPGTVSNSLMWVSGNYKIKDIFFATLPDTLEVAVSEVEQLGLKSVPMCISGGYDSDLI